MVDPIEVLERLDVLRRDLADVALVLGDLPDPTLLAFMVDAVGKVSTVRQLYASNHVLPLEAGCAAWSDCADRDKPGGCAGCPCANRLNES